MKYPLHEPTVRNTASVITTDISLRFMERHQVDELFTYLVKEGYSFSFERIGGDSLNPDIFTIDIEDIPWANNVTRLFKFIEDLDYNTGDVDE